MMGDLQYINVADCAVCGQPRLNLFFLERATPSLALISAGLDNRFHHPNADVVTRLEQLGATTLRTDQLGLVSVFTDGKRLSVESFRWQATRAPWFPVFGD